ncbi:Pimeloyl-ACP methyl ester carboxylesterase [Asanoa hainanensis]|uniref:Pimeloyl-ACP methyl ester carboxylesterase n=1 Tax=Asanoa hainanensis TaxID=560556 RepID=A0A239P1G2_9ACTN|nr:alpha/beta fold hydrolase [Asanoa hainanensis]SNT60468.1 Pimeloyl-ACP methyl ester carboxylesterase [Asanoa hainanensis]
MIEPLSYDVRGTGPGLVLVHGTGSTGLKSWGTVLDGLAARHTVVLPNLPGSGDTPPVAKLDVAGLADRVVATAVAAGLDDFALGGASLGAPIAIAAAARHPQRVSRLVSVVGFARARPTLRLNLELWGAMFARGDADLGKLLVGMSFAEEFLATLTDEQLDRYAATLTADPAPGTVAQTDLGARLDVREDLARVTAPTLVVVATGDRCVAPVHSREIADGIPGARLVEVPGGHAARFEDPERTLSVIVDFLETTT